LKKKEQQIAALREELKNGAISMHQYSDLVLKVLMKNHVTLEMKIKQMMSEGKSPKEVCLFSLRIPPDTRYKIKGLKEYLSDYVNSVKLDKSLQIFLTK
jgi:hypothetical protein